MEAFSRLGDVSGSRVFHTLTVRRPGNYLTITYLILTFISFWKEGGADGRFIPFCPLLLGDESLVMEQKKKADTPRAANEWEVFAFYVCDLRPPDINSNCWVAGFPWDLPDSEQDGQKKSARSRQINFSDGKKAQKKENFKNLEKVAFLTFTGLCQAYSFNSQPCLLLNLKTTLEREVHGLDFKQPLLDGVRCSCDEAPGCKPDQEKMFLLVSQLPLPNTAGLLRALRL